MRKINAVLLSICLPASGLAHADTVAASLSPVFRFQEEALEVRVVESGTLWQHPTRAQTPNFQVLRVDLHPELPEQARRPAPAGPAIALPIPAPSAGKVTRLATARLEGRKLVIAEEDRQHLAERFLSAMDLESDRPEALQALLPVIRVLGERRFDWPAKERSRSDQFNSWSKKLDKAIPADKNLRKKFYGEIIRALHTAPEETLNKLLFELLEQAANPLEYAIAIDVKESWKNVEVDWILNERTLLSMDPGSGRLAVAALADAARLDYSMYCFLALGHIAQGLRYRRIAATAGAPEYMGNPFIQEIASVLKDLKDVSTLQKFEKNTLYTRRKQRREYGWEPTPKSKLHGRPLLYNLRIAGAKPYADLMERLMRTDDHRERVALIVQAIGQDPEWSARVGGPSHYNIDRVADEVKALQDAADAGRASFEDHKTSAASGSRKVVVDVAYVKEVERDPLDYKIPNEIEGIGSDPAPLGPDRRSTPKTPAVPPLRIDPHQPDLTEYVYVRPNLGSAHYQELIRQAREHMDDELGPRMRTEIFLREVWPRFLIAASDESVDNPLEDLVINAAKSLDSGFAEMIGQMVRLAWDPAANRGKIEELAGRLRGSAFLHSQNLYLSCELLDRFPPGSSRKVTLLSSVSFEIDDHPWRRNYSILAPSGKGGTTVETLFLGRRVDRLNQEMSYLGFYFTGDTYGVVVKENILDIAYGRSGELGILAGVPVSNRHPINQAIDEAVHRDYPAHPTEKEIEAILEDRYRSTALHERQHTEDHLRGMFEHLPPVERRIHMEISAYLASMAYGESPFVELVHIMKLLISYRRAGAFASFGDLFRVYEWASLNILLALAEELDVPVTVQDLMDRPADECDRILRAALKLNSVELRRVARKVHLDFLAGRQSVYDRPDSQTEPRATAESPEPTAPPKPGPPPAVKESSVEDTVREVVRVGTKIPRLISNRWDRFRALMSDPQSILGDLLRMLAVGLGAILIITFWDNAAHLADFVSGLKIPFSIEKGAPITSPMAPAQGLSRGPLIISPRASSTYQVQPGQSFDEAARQIMAQSDPSRSYWYPEAYYIMADNITSALNGDVDRLSAEARLIVRPRYHSSDPAGNLEWERMLYQILGRRLYEKRITLLQAALRKEAERAPYSQGILDEIKRRAGARWPHIQGDIRARQEILRQIEKESGMPLERKDMENVFNQVLTLSERVLSENPAPRRHSRLQGAA